MIDIVNSNFLLKLDRFTQVQQKATGSLQMHELSEFVILAFPGSVFQKPHLKSSLMYLNSSATHWERNGFK